VATATVVLVVKICGAGSPAGCWISAAESRGDRSLYLRRRRGSRSL